MIHGGTSADVSELAIFKAEDMDDYSCYGFAC